MVHGDPSTTTAAIANGQPFQQALAAGDIDFVLRAGIGRLDAGKTVVPNAFLAHIYYFVSGTGIVQGNRELIFVKPGSFVATRRLERHEITADEGSELGWWEVVLLSQE